MTEAGNTHITFRNSSDPLVEVLALERGSYDKFYRIAFRVSEIARLMEVDEKTSALILQDHITIAVAMPFAVLKKAIYEPDFKASPMIDLTKVTGPATQEAYVPQLSEVFNGCARKPGESLLIRAVFEDRQGNNKKLQTISYKKVGCVESHTESYNKTYIGFLDGSGVYVSMPALELRAAIVRADQENWAVLDLTETKIGRPGTPGKEMRP